MGVNSLPKTVTRQRRGCDLNPGPTAPESSTLITRLLSRPAQICTPHLIHKSVPPYQKRNVDRFIRFAGLTGVPTSHEHAQMHAMLSNNERSRKMIVVVS